jgi:uncharacterized protein (DUF1499 family)
MTLRPLDPIVEPVSMLAVWSRRLAAFSLPVIALGIVVTRFDFLEFQTALATLVAGLGLAVLAVLLALAAYVVIWRSGAPGVGLATTGLLLGLLILAFPAFVIAHGASYPMLADVTTDAADPPRFDAVLKVRGADANPTTYPGAATYALQTQAFPRIEPVVVDRAPDEVMVAILRLVERRGWSIIERRQPSALRDGHIEAVARTPLLGMRDDVVVRIRKAGDGARIDVRSASRYGRHDLGANGLRVDALLDDIAGAVAVTRAR